MRTYTRRAAIRYLGAGGALAAAHARAQRSALLASTDADQPARLQPIVTAAVARNDTAVRAVLPAQITDLASPYRGSVPDAVGLHSAGSAGSAIEVCAAAFVHPQSAFHGDTALLDRIRLAAGFLERSQSADGNIDLLSTNFNSPPDTGFVVNNVATAAAVGRRRGATVFQQELEAPYYQPIGRPVTTTTWAATRRERRQSEVNRLTQSIEVAEVPRGLRLRVQAHGTAGVPVSVEIAFRDGGRIDGCTPLAGSTDAFLLERGTGTYRAGRNEIRFGPGTAPHRYAQVRGAEPKLAGPSVHLTGYTPFDHTLTIEGA